jgi:hypothetical protein
MPPSNSELLGISNMPNTVLAARCPRASQQQYGRTDLTNIDSLRCLIYYRDLKVSEDVVK